MSTEGEHLQYRPIRTPREDRTAFVEPPLREAGALLAENRRRHARSEYDFQGRSLADLSRQARTELLREARRWTAAYRDVEPASSDPEGPILLAGHQPELFHPGVWFKNFALGILARQHGAAAVNLVIDSDTAKGASLRTPGGPVAAPRVTLVPFDRPGPRVPYEERRIEDCELFTRFGRQAAEVIRPLVPNPLVERYWLMALGRSRETDRLGECLAQARHQLEGRWGLQTLEIPQSWVCNGESFFWLVAHLAAQLPRFRAAYNEAVHEYRRVHRIRNPAHPVPDLAAEGPWLEAPLWIWSAADPQRRKLYVRASGRETVLSDRRAVEIRLPLTPDGDAARAAEQLAEWGRRGVKIRSRALVTTLWARLVLGDLFLHGIGGAKYDQVTDLLIRRFFGLQPPGIMVLSATLHLPIPRPPVTVDQARAIHGELRDLTWHPEKFILRDAQAGHDVPGDVKRLIAEKQRWIGTPPTRDNAAQRRQAIRRSNNALQPWVDGHRQRLLDLQAQMARALQAERVLASREYAFCLYPEKILREFLGELLPKMA